MLLHGIINTKIVKAEWDEFWLEGSIDAHYKPKDCLVVTQSFALGTPEEIQLKKMIGACGIDTLNVNTIHINNLEKLSWRQLKEKLDPKYVLLLGIQPIQLGISALFRLNEPNYFDHCLLIPALSLTEMETMPEMKKELWLNGLKPVFVDKTVSLEK
jgi:hypothetical protein